MIDIHIHTRFSFDSEELPENYIKRAIYDNVPVIGFSEHYDYDAVLDGGNVQLVDVQEYVSYINNLKKQIKIPQILCGIEFGYSKGAIERYQELDKQYNFDYIINSVHTLPGRGDSFYARFFEGKTTTQAYNDYFDAVLESVNAPYDYQIIGHIGYVSRYCKGEDSRIFYKDYKTVYRQILEGIIKKDKCLEINTSSGNAQSQFLPDRDVIEEYLSLGGTKLSFAGDAHTVKDYLRKSDLVHDFLLSIGVNKLCYYHNKNAKFYKI
jgi:histidinol-phosphatase (PHP family)